MWVWGGGNGQRVESGKFYSSPDCHKKRNGLNGTNKQYVNNMYITLDVFTHKFDTRLIFPDFSIFSEIVHYRASQNIFKVNL